MMKVPDDFGVSDSDLTDVVIPNDIRLTKDVERHITDSLAQCAFSPDAIFAIKLSLEEALTNAIKHGNSGDPNRHITIRYHIDRQRAVIMVRDEGGGFCPSSVPDPTSEENLERPNGRGIMLMQSYMTKVRFSPTGNEVWLLKERVTGGPPNRSRTPPAD